MPKLKKKINKSRLIWVSWEFLTSDLSSMWNACFVLLLNSPAECDYKPTLFPGSSTPPGCLWGTAVFQRVTHSSQSHSPQRDNEAIHCPSAVHYTESISPEMKSTNKPAFFFFKICVELLNSSAECVGAIPWVGGRTGAKGRRQDKQKTAVCLLKSSRKPKQV